MRVCSTVGLPGDSRKSKPEQMPKECHRNKVKIRCPHARLGEFLPRFAPPRLYDKRSFKISCGFSVIETWIAIFPAQVEALFRRRIDQFPELFELLLKLLHCSPRRDQGRQSIGARQSLKESL